MRLTLQVHHNRRGWLDAGTLTPHGGQRFAFEYDVDYASEFLGRRDRYAVSVRRPVDLARHEADHAFLLDLVPQGEALMGVPATVIERSRARREAVQRELEGRL